MKSPDKQKKTTSKSKQVRVMNPVYGNPKPGFAPRCVYAYYLKETGIPKERVQAFFIERANAITNIRTEAETILGEIRNRTVKPCGWGLGDIKWRRRSFILILFEDQNHKLEQDNAVTFRPYHTFRGGGDILSFASYPNVTGFFCENHLVVPGGGDVDYRGDNFWMEVNHVHGVSLQIQSHNDTGTNMGPPIPPP